MRFTRSLQAALASGGRAERGGASFEDGNHLLVHVSARRGVALPDGRVGCARGSWAHRPQRETGRRVPRAMRPSTDPPAKPARETSEPPNAPLTPTGAKLARPSSARVEEEVLYDAERRPLLQPVRALDRAERVLEARRSGGSPPSPRQRVRKESRVGSGRDGVRAFAASESTRSQGVGAESQRAPQAWPAPRGRGEPGQASGVHLGSIRQGGVLPTRCRHVRRAKGVRGGREGLRRGIEVRSARRELPVVAGGDRICPTAAPGQCRIHRIRSG